MICDCIERVERYLEVIFLETLQPLKKRLPLARPIEPALPFRFKLLLDCLGESPESHAIRGIEDFATAMGCDGADGPRLREIVCSWKTSANRGSAESAELTTSIPPLGEIHLAKSRND